MGFRIRARNYWGSCCLSLVAILVCSMWESGKGHEVQERELLNMNNLNLGIVVDMCGRADYPSLCRSVVKGLTNPTLAIETAIRQLMFQTNLAKGKAAQKRKGRKKWSQEMDVCYENYDDAYSNLETCLENLKSRDKPSLNINLSAALTDYVTCDDALAQRAISSPVTRTNLTLRQMASNCLYLSSLIRLR